VEGVLNFCHYCLNDDKLTDYMDFFDAHGVGFVNASPFSMGLLSQRGVPQCHPAPSDLVESCRMAADYCKSRLSSSKWPYVCVNELSARRCCSTTSAERVRQTVNTC
jgi:aryl-alcohol dehydrogenase-like predicted oxidoreductase